ncbi:MAG: hypothetical protein K0S61_4468 [Anaerocolumna sp.]|jgi:predicted Zn-dependent peptidase|nr:hypothetical protein [Anaerocolumna sp.]
MDRNYIISYGLYLIITVILSYGVALLKKIKEDKNSFYNKQLAYINQKQEALKTQIGQEEYNHAKEVAQNIVCKMKQLGKEFAWDAVTKHAKVAEEIAAKCTGLSEEDIYNIIKTTVGMLNAKRKVIESH